MIAGIGTDLVYIPRMRKLIAKHGDRIAQRILTEEELVEFHHNPDPAAYLAKRFAAKEAAAKALGTGFRDGLSLKHIQIKNNALGKPELCFLHRGQELVQARDIGASLVSLSDERHYALAFVTLMERQT